MLKNKKITVGTEFENRMQYLITFKHLIKEETFELLQETTKKVPLNKLIKDEENIYYLYIIDEIDEEIGIKNTYRENEDIWIRDVYDIEEPVSDIIDDFFNARYVFLCIKKEKIYKFLGLYELASTDENGYCKEWKRKDANKFILDKRKIYKMSIDNYIKDGKIYSKELALKILKEEKVYDIKNINKKLRRDKDIIEAFWNAVKEMKDGYYYNNIRIIISVDQYGDKVIDEFLKSEKKRHSFKVKNQYEKNTEIVQFLKFKEIDEKKLEIFNEELEPIIIIIGEKENNISKEIKEKYKKLFFIEVYMEASNVSNAKMITKDIEKTINLLRVITYNDTTTRIGINQGIHYYIKNCVEDFVKNGNIEVQMYKGTVKQLKRKIEEMPKSIFPEVYMVQTVYNKKFDEYTLNEIYKILNSAKKNKIIGYYIQHECKIKDIEMIIMKINLK